MMKSLVVGVTGRRRIVPESLPQIERSTRIFMENLGQCAYQSVVVCSGMAIGADTLAARAVLAEKERAPETKLRLRAVLPMPLALYLDDFKREEQAELRAILERCDEVVELPCNVDESGATDRAAQYEKLRDYLVAESDVLLAYWSGNSSVVKKGGTVDVVLSKAQKLMAGQSGAIFCIATPELLRFKNCDGVKTYVPEELPEPGRCSLSLFGDAEKLLSPETFLPRN